MELNVQSYSAGNDSEYLQALVIKIPEEREWMDGGSGRLAAAWKPTGSLSLCLVNGAWED